MDTQKSPSPFAMVVHTIQRLVAKQLVLSVLEQLAYPKWPQRTPRKLKKAARSALPMARARFEAAKREEAERLALIDGRA
jgi:hypothetical protein